MLHEFLWHDNSFKRRKTKLLCTEHGLQKALTINENDQAVLECGCYRAQALPLAPGRVSVEHFGSRAPETIKRVAQKLFPAVSPHHDWELELAA